MTKKELLRFFENYYGEIYQGVVLDAMAEYLNGFPEDFFQAAAEVLVKRFSRVYCKAPGPAEVERCMDEILAKMPKPDPLPYQPQGVSPDVSESERQAALRALKTFRQGLAGKGQGGPMAESVKGSLGGSGGGREK